MLTRQLHAAISFHIRYTYFSHKAQYIFRPLTLKPISTVILVLASAECFPIFFSFFFFCQYSEDKVILAMRAEFPRGPSSGTCAVYIYYRNTGDTV